MDVNQTRLNEGRERYEKAMKFLSAPALGQGGKTNLEVYTEHQAKYTAAVAKKNEAYSQAQEMARRNREDRPEVVQQIYSDWIKENGPFWRNYVQEVYINWVTKGKKEEVEYWFSGMGMDTDMSRIE